MGIDELLIPPEAGVGSAIGFLQAPFSYEASRGFYQRLDSFDAGAVNATLAELTAEAEGFVEDGAPAAKRSAATRAMMRYAGQGWEIPVPLSHSHFRAEDVGALQTAFEAAYRTLFGRIIEGLAIEVTNWLVRVAADLPPPELSERFDSFAPHPCVRQRQVFDAGLRQQVEAQEVPRAALAPGQGISGPAIITEENTSTIVTAGFVAIAQGDGALRLIRQRGEAP